jgi:hypothetical protein
MVVVNVYRGSELAKSLNLSQLTLKLNGQLTNISDAAKGLSHATLVEGGKRSNAVYYGSFKDKQGNVLEFETPDRPKLSISDLFLIPKLKGDYNTTITIIRK